MLQSISVEVPIQDPTQVGEARRLSAKFAEHSHLSEKIKSSLAIVVNELATNILKHAKSGSIILTANESSTDVIAVDSGPGMEDLSKCLEDGYSTAGTAGNGLGAVRRLSQTSDFYSISGKGFVAFARFQNEAPNTNENFEYAGVNVPFPGEEVSGDSWELIANDKSIAIAVVDGLGHGLLAAQAAEVGVRSFSEKPFLAPQTTIQSMHGSLRGTRGAAAAVAQVDMAHQTMQYCGIGNISCVEISYEKVRRMISYEGTLGLQVRRIQELTYPLEQRNHLILHSDGITTSWDLAKYPGLSRRHPGIIAGILFRDFRKKDDSTVVVLSRRGGTR